MKVTEKNAIVLGTKALRTIAKVQSTMLQRLEDAERNSNTIRVDVSQVSDIIKEFQKLEKRLDEKKSAAWAAALRSRLEVTIGVKIAKI